MKMAKLLMKKIMPVFLSLVLVIGMCGIYVKTDVTATQVEEEQQVVTEGESISGDDQQEEAGDNQEISEDTSDVEEDTEEVTEEDTEAEDTEAEDTEEEADEATTEDITAELQAELTTIKFELEWVCEDETSIPDEMTFVLKSDEDETLSKPLTIAKNAETPASWTGDFEPLNDSFDPELEYKVSFDAVEGFEIDEDLSGFDGEDTYYLTLTDGSTPVDPTYDSITVSKTFDCTDGGKPQDVTFTLTVADDESYSKEYTLKMSASEFEEEETEEGLWLAEKTIEPGTGEVFSTSYTYTLEEADLANFTKDISEFDADAQSFEVTNTYEAPAPVDNYDGIKVTKIWDGGAPLEEITFNLLQDGKKIDTLTIENPDSDASAPESDEVQEGDDTSEDVVRTTEWESEFTGTYPKNHTYTLEENVNGTDITLYNYTPSGLDNFDKKNGAFTVTNTYSVVDTMTVFVKKYWSGAAADAINVTLYTDKECTAEFASYDIYGSSADTGNGYWFYEIVGLPKQDADGNYISYYLVESAMDGFTCSTPAVIEENGLKGWKITNTYIGTNGYNDPANATTESTESAKTGDNNNLFLYIGILLVAGIGVVAAVIFKKKNK